MSVEPTLHDTGLNEISPIHLVANPTVEGRFLGRPLNSNHILTPSLMPAPMKFNLKECLNLSLKFLASLLLLWAINPELSFAASEEIQVYLDEFADRGKFGLDFHTNYVTRADAGANSRDMLRVTPELSYGINDNWEGALYWLTSSGPEQNMGQPLSDGIKMRVKWRPQAPSVQSPWYWAVNFEVGELAKRFYPEGTSGELKLIGLWRSGAWTLGGNFNIQKPFKAYTPQGTAIEVDGKIAYRVAGSADMDLQLGLEHYAGLGTLKNLYSTDERTSLTFLVADFAIKGWDFNVGLGTATGATQDKTILKMILGVPF